MPSTDEARPITTDEDRTVVRHQILDEINHDSNKPVLRRVQDKTHYDIEGIVGTFNELMDEGAFVCGSISESSFIRLSDDGRSMLTSHLPGNAQA